MGELSHKGSTRGRKTVTAPTSSIDMFLWRSYLIFAACTAPPIAFQESYSTPVASDSRSVTMVILALLYSSAVVVYGQLGICSDLLYRCYTTRERLKK